MNVLLLFALFATILSVFKDLLDTDWKWGNGTIISLMTLTITLLVFIVNVLTFISSDKNHWKVFLFNFYKTLLMDFGNDFFELISGRNQPFFCNQAMIEPEPFYGEEVLGVVKKNLSFKTPRYIRDSKLLVDFDFKERNVSVKMSFYEVLSFLKIDEDELRDMVFESFGEKGFLKNTGNKKETGEYIYERCFGRYGDEISVKDMDFVINFKEGVSNSINAYMPRKQKRFNNNIIYSIKDGEYFLGHEVKVKIIKFYLNLMYFVVVLPFHIIFNIISLFGVLLCLIATFVFNPSDQGKLESFKIAFSTVGRFFKNIDLGFLRIRERNVGFLEMSEDSLYPNISNSGYVSLNDNKGLLKNLKFSDLDNPEHVYFKEEFQVGNLMFLMNEEFYSIRLKGKTVWLLKGRNDYDSFKKICFLLEFWSNDLKRGILDLNKEEKNRKGCYIMHCLNFKELIHLLREKDCEVFKIFLAPGKYLVEDNSSFGDTKITERNLEIIEKTISDLILPENRKILSKILEINIKHPSFLSGIDLKNFELMMIEDLLRLKSFNLFSLNIKKWFLDKGKGFKNYFSQFNIKKAYREADYFLRLINYGYLSGLDTNIRIHKDVVQLCRTHCRLWENIDLVEREISWEKIYSKFLEIDDKKKARKHISKGQSGNRIAESLHSLSSDGAEKNRKDKRAITEEFYKKSMRNTGEVVSSKGEILRKYNLYNAQGGFFKIKFGSVKVERNQGSSKEVDVFSEVEGIYNEKLKRREDLKNRIVDSYKERLVKNIEAASEAEGGREVMLSLSHKLITEKLNFKNRTLKSGSGSSEGGKGEGEKGEGEDKPWHQPKLRMKPKGMQKGKERNDKKRGNGGTNNNKNEEKFGLNKMRNFTSLKWLTGKSVNNIYKFLETKEFKLEEFKGKFKNEMETVIKNLENKKLGNNCSQTERMILDTIDKKREIFTEREKEKKRKEEEERVRKEEELSKLMKLKEKEKQEREERYKNKLKIAEDEKEREKQERRSKIEELARIRLERSLKKLKKEKEEEARLKGGKKEAQEEEEEGGLFGFFDQEEQGNNEEEEEGMNISFFGLDDEF